jgi:hypothetical protein
MGLKAVKWPLKAFMTKLESDFVEYLRNTGAIFTEKAMIEQPGI